MQVDTFEAVKNNVYSVLGDLAKDLNGPELDLLFSKFEACTGWPAPDTPEGHGPAQAAGALRRQGETLRCLSIVACKGMACHSLSAFLLLGLPAVKLHPA